MPRNGFRDKRVTGFWLQERQRKNKESNKLNNAKPFGA